VYEDSVSTFIEARDQLLLSILDGLDVEDSIEEYVFAKANMEAEDFSHDITWRENICDSFVRKQYIPKEEYQQQISFDNDRHLSTKQPWRNRVKGRGTSHHHDLEVSPFGNAPYGDAESHFLHPHYDSSRRVIPSTGRSIRDEVMINQVLPRITNQKTHARISSAVEHAQDRRMRRDKSPHYVGMGMGDSRKFHGLGPLGGLNDNATVKTVEDAYERDFQKWLSGDEGWKSINPDTGEVDHEGSWRQGAIADAKAEGLSPDVPEGHFYSKEELLLRKLHAEDRARSWNHDHVDNEEPEFTGYEDFEPGRMIEHGYKLGTNSFIHQLQWFSPRERTAIMSAVKDGLDKMGNQNIKLPDGSTVSAGRIKRSTRTILNQMTNRMGRTAGMTHENLFPKRESNEHDLSAEQQLDFFDGLDTVVHDGEHFGEIQEALREALGLSLAEDGNLYDEQGRRHNPTNFLPKLRKHKEGLSDDDIAAHYEKPTTDIVNSGHTDKKHTTKQILYALGYNEDLTEIGADDNHHYPNYSGPLISREKLDGMLAQAKENSGLAKFAKEMRNDLLLYDGYYFKEEDLTPEEREVMKDLKVPGSSGYYGLGGIFSPIFAGGGSNRNPHTLMEMLAEHTADEEGNSHIGLPSGERFVINPDNIGLFGSQVGHRQRVFSTPQAIQSKYHNTKDATESGASPKNQTTANVSTLAPGLANSISGMTKDEMKATYAGDYNIFSRMLSSLPFGSIAPHGKGTRRTKKAAPDIGGTNLTADLGIGETLSAPSEVSPTTYREQVHRDDVSKHQATWGHSIGTILGRGTIKPRPRAVMQNFLANSMRVSEDGHTFGDRVGEGANEFMAEHFGLDVPTETTGSIPFYDPDAEAPTYRTETQLIDRRNARTNHRNHVDRILTHHSAIEEMAKVLAKLKPPGTFDVSNPNLHGEVDVLFKEANLALMYLPRGHEIELPDGTTWTNDLTVGGLGVDVQQTPIQATGFKNLPNHMREKGLKVDADTTLTDLMQHLSMGEDHKHRDHYREVLESIKASLDPNDKEDHRLLMSVNSLITDAPELYLPGGERMFSGHEGFDYTDVLDHETGNMHDYLSLLRGVGNHGQEKSAEDFLSDYLVERGEPLSESKGAIQMSGPFNRAKRIADELRAFRSNFSQKPIQDSLDNLGVMRYAAPEEGRGKNRVSMLTGAKLKAGKSNQGLKAKTDYAIHALKDILVHDPNVDLESAPDLIESKMIGFGPRELHPMGVDGNGILDLYGYTNLLDFSNMRMKRSDFGIDATFGQLDMGTNTMEQPTHPVPVDAISRVLSPDHATEVQRQDSLPENQFMGMANAFRPGMVSQVPDTSPMTITASEPSDYATFLLNPDSLVMKGDDTPNFVPPIRPMHRIFDFKDMEQLRGFTGSWVVSKWYDGERVVIMKLADKVSAYNENNSRMSVPDWVKEGVKGLGKKDCTLDAILAEDEMHVIDITYYDDTDVTDMTIQERLKILRGQYDGYNKVTIPGPHDTRMTDDEGLEDTVKSLLDEHDCLLIRDGKSTYMKGERRHPKWVLLRPNKNVNLKVLDKRGKKNITYRLGAGPLIDDEGIESATVEHEGEVYLDVGTVSSPKSFDEGDIVEVEVTGVKRKKMNGREVYDLNPVKLVGEGQGEASVSMETLNILAKSTPNLHFPHDIDIQDDTIIVKTMVDNDVFYTLEKSDLGYWVHSPRTVLSEFGESDYSIRLSDSLKPYWSQVASMMLKGKVEKRPIPEKKVQDKAKTLAERNQLLKPQMEKALSVMVRALDALEKGHGGHFPMSGSKGLGIDVGGGVASPRGPTTLDGEQTVPDYDMRARPTEDDEKPYPHMKRQQKRFKGIKQGDSGEDKEIVSP
jgi:hypothetical protein